MTYGVYSEKVISNVRQDCYSYKPVVCKKIYKLRNQFDWDANDNILILLKMLKYRL